MYRPNQRKIGMMIVMMFGETGRRKGGRKSETVLKKGRVQAVLVNLRPIYPSR